MKSVEEIKMKLNVEAQGQYKVVTLQERRLDLFSSPKLKENLDFLINQYGEKDIILDLNNCSYCDTSGLSVILWIKMLCENAYGNLIITNIHRNVEKLFRLCKLDSLLTLE